MPGEAARLMAKSGRIGVDKCKKIQGFAGVSLETGRVRTSGHGEEGNQRRATFAIARR
jgi:hypothetical protein